MAEISSDSMNGKHLAPLSGRRLIFVFILLFAVAGLTIHLSLDSGNKVSDRAEMLVSQLVPELRAISTLQRAMNRRVIELHQYYATVENPEPDSGLTIELEFEQHASELATLGYNKEQLAMLQEMIDGFIASTKAFDQEMQDSRDWDVLRQHLARAQEEADRIDVILRVWLQGIRGRAGNGGAMTLEEVSRLNKMQLGFAAGVAIVAVLVLVAVYARLKDQARLYHQVYEDELTGLPSRKALERDWLRIERQHGQKTYAMMLISIDRFNLVTGIYGHLVGDQMVKTVSDWFVAQVSSTKAELYRFSSSTWAVVVPEDRKLRQALRLASRISDISLSPIYIEQRPFNLSCSIGISYYPDDAVTLESVMRNADAAHREAAVNGGNAYKCYQEEMNRRIEHHMSVENELRHAIEAGELELHYQPKVDTNTGQMTGAEALIRWRHGNDLVMPGEFIPIAEQSALIVSVGNWVLLHACRQWVIWRNNGLPVVPLAVNISAQQFQEVDFPAHVGQVLAETGMPAEYLELEITEEAAAEKPEHVAEIMMGLKSIGVKLALDDFGTGYSSLSYLKTFPLDVLKIDRSFVMRMTESEGDMAIVKMVMSLVKELKLKTVAEGVETQAQREALRNLHCDQLQGFLFDKPLPQHEFESRLRHL